MLKDVFLECPAAIRSLRRGRGLVGTSLFVLAAGVGATAAIFGVAHSVLLAPLPYPQQDRLVAIWTVNETEAGRDGSSYLNIADWRAGATSVESMGLFYRPEFTQRTVTGTPAPYRVQVGAVDAAFFDAVGLAPALGRVLRAEDEVARAPVAVLGHDFWMRAFGGDPGVVGGSIELDGEDRRIVGIMGPEMSLPIAGTDLWEPHSLWTEYPDSLGPRGDDLFGVLARLSPGIELSRLRAELDRTSEELARLHPDANRGKRAAAHPLIDEIVDAELRRSLWLLVAAVVGLFLAVCANVGQLWTARGMSRIHELSLRTALGASRRRLAALLMAEALLVSAVAVLLGLGLAELALESIVRTVPVTVPRLHEATLHPRVVLATCTLGLLTAPLVAWLPIVRLSSTRPVSAIREEGGRGVVSSSRRAKRAFSIIQISLATFLLVSGTLLLRSLGEAAGGDRGVDTNGAWVATIALPSDRYPPFEDTWLFFDDLSSRVSALPGVTSVGVLSDFVHRRNTANEVHLPDRDTPISFEVMSDAVMPGYEAALGLSILEGEPLTRDDRWLTGAGWRITINRTLADRLWPGEDAVGKELMMGRRSPNKPWYEVVGVVEDDRRRGLDRAAIGHVYHVLPDDDMDLVVRAERGAEVLADVTRVMNEMDPNLAAPVFRSARSLLADTIALRRMHTFLVALAAACAVLLSLIGVFGLLVESVTSRREEIGVRMALGARPARMVFHFVRDGMALGVTGAAGGLGGALAAGGLLRSFLFGVAPWDPASLAFALLAVLALCTVASLFPALRAARVHPSRSLSGP